MGLNECDRVAIAQHSLSVAWDYYEIWQSLHAIKSKIDAGLEFIATQEKLHHLSNA
jgi:hypothetical protein